MSDTAVVAAPAKVNLFLRVLDRRADGYHEVETLFQAIDLVDEVKVELGGSPRRSGRWWWSVSWMGSSCFCSSFSPL